MTNEESENIGCVEGLFSMLDTFLLCIWTYRMVTRFVEAVEDIRDVAVRMEERAK